MHRCLPAGVLALLGVCLLGLNGCASSPPTRLYVLPSLSSAETAPPAAPRDLTIGVGPVALHPYLDRLQIVTRASRARLERRSDLVDQASPAVDAHPTLGRQRAQPRRDLAWRDHSARRRPLHGQRGVDHGGVDLDHEIAVVGAEPASHALRVPDGLLERDRPPSADG